jgi:mRNA interferase HigB
MGKKAHAGNITAHHQVRSLTGAIPLWDNIAVEIINLTAITDFGRRYPLSRKPLSRWIDITAAAAWRSIIDVQNNFRTAEDVKGYVVFNIHGNHYRLITVIRYERQQVIVHEVFTHSDYDRWQP